MIDENSLQKENEDCKVVAEVNGNTTEDVALLKTPVVLELKYETKLYFRRWIMLILFVLCSLTNAFQWIHLVIITNILEKYYNASLPEDKSHKTMAIEWLSMVYMLAYIPLIFPATWLLDKKGLRWISIIANLLNCLGAWIKCGAVSSDRFGVLMAGQAICAIAQVFILGVPARLAAVWFGPNEVSTATAIGVFGNQFGCALGFFIPPEVIPNSESLDDIGYNLSKMLYGTAAVSTVLLILVVIFFRGQPAEPPSKAQAEAVVAASQENYLASLKRLFSNSAFLLLLATYGANTGVYYAIGTLLNPIILNYFPAQEVHAGRIGLVLVVAGVGGSILAGIWLDKTKLFKQTTVGIYVMSFICLVVFSFTLSLEQIWIAYICGGLLGFFMTGYLPVGFEFGVEITYPESEGTSSGLLNTSAQIFGIILTLSMTKLKDAFSVWAGNMLVCAVLLAGAIITVFIRADLRRQKAGLAVVAVTPSTREDSGF